MHHKTKVTFKIFPARGYLPGFLAEDMQKKLLYPLKL